MKPLTTRQVRREYSQYKCNRFDYAAVSILGRAPVRVMGLWVTAWKALEATLIHAGYPPAEIVGSYNCRTIAGIRSLSLHSYRAAIDVDPRKNARRWRLDYTKTLLTAEQVRAVEALRSVSGHPLFVSGVHFRHVDPMHFQIAAPIVHILSGVAGDTVATHHHHEAHTTTHHTTDHHLPEVSVTLPKLRRGDRGQPVKNMQGLLAAHDEHVEHDGVFGHKTDQAVRHFQGAHSLHVDGIVGPDTWAKMLG